VYLRMENTSKMFATSILAEISTSFFSLESTKFEIAVFSATFEINYLLLKH
jgi:hypothetical protein